MYQINLLGCVDTGNGLLFISLNQEKNIYFVTFCIVLFYTGGEYQQIDSMIFNFLSRMKTIGIECTFYVDGAKGSSEETTRVKMDTWIKRLEGVSGRSWLFDNMFSIQILIIICIFLVGYFRFLVSSWKDSSSKQL